MKITHLYTAKGGQGCTVTAALFALMQPGRTLIVDDAPVPDMPAVLGLQIPQDWEDGGVTAQVSPTVDLVRYQVTSTWAADYDNVVYDHGRDEPPDYHGDERWYMVIRPCYLAIRHAICHDHRPDGIIVVREPARALTETDIEATLSTPIVATIDIDPSVARMVDAGLMASRYDRRKLRILNDTLQGR